MLGSSEVSVKTGYREPIYGITVFSIRFLHKYVVSFDGTHNNESSGISAFRCVTYEFLVFKENVS